MQITSNQVLAEEYAEAIQDALHAFLDSSSFGRPPSDTAAFLLGNEVCMQEEASARHALRESGSSYTSALMSAAATLAHQDSLLAGSIEGGYTP